MIAGRFDREGRARCRIERVHSEQGPQPIPPEFEFARISRHNRQVHVTIYSDNGSNRLGTALETWSITESTTPFTYATGSYASGLTLEQGQKYWVLAVAPTDAPVQRWNSVNYVDGGPHFNFIGISDCCAQEVTTGTYVGSDSVKGFAMRVTMATSIATAVPEPATWTMLIAGFGMIGAASRRKAQGIQLSR